MPKIIDHLASYDSTCKRCFQSCLITTMSIFEPVMICENCEHAERNHADYEHAKHAELEQVKLGNYKFPGIGKPADL
jgi:hypothetical protein